MQIVIPILIEMSDGQVGAYADEYGLPRQPNGRVMAKDVVDNVRGYVLNHVQQSAAFADGGADVSIKGR
jgi:hypothetical protein